MINNINWNDFYEVDPECPWCDIALLIDNKIKKIWIRNFELKATKKRIKLFSQIAELARNNNIFSLEELEDMNNGKPEVESIQRHLERINKLLRDNGKAEIFIPANIKYHYYLNSKGLFQNVAVI